MSGPRVLVVGGGRGIGRATALRFAREGARVVVAARTSEELDAVVQEIDRAGGKSIPAQVNVADHGSVEAAVWRALEFTGGALDVLVNSAGVFAIKPFAQMDTETWKRHLEVNLTGPFYTTLEALEGLEQGERAHVFNVSSIAGRRGFPGNTAYCASKYGLRGFSDALRLDLADKGIRVTTVYPGRTDTSLWDSVEGDFDRATMARPEEVAEAIWRAWTAPEGEEVDDLDLSSGLEIAG